MKKILMFVVAVCAVAVFGATRTEVLRQKLASADRNYIFVAMHRGDWRNFPENSKGAILSAISIGADIVELDVQRTKDGRFILNHDGSVDRTTNGKGRVCDLTLEEIKKLRLRGRNGQPSEYEVLTLEEALALTKGKILVNIDKFTQHPREILDAVSAVGALKEVLVKASFSAGRAKEQFGPYWAKVESGELLYMPVVNLGRDNYYKPVDKSTLPGYFALEPRKSSMYELCFHNPDDVPGALERIPSNARIWANTLWDSISAKHSDKAALRDPDGNWGWWIDRGATMIQSDYAAELICYLVRKGKRSLSK